MPIEIFSIFALIMSAVFHEVAHGLAAYKLGDDTAKNMGRLTFNPLKHLDPFGSVLLPVLLIISGFKFVIGWAKPVPYNPYNLRDNKFGDLKVALAGPGANFLLALFFGLLARFLPISQSIKISLVINNNDFLLSQMHGSLIISVFVLSFIICYINLFLMIFNLIPIPPLDGSKVLINLLPYGWREKYYKLEQYGMFIIIFLLMFGFFSIVSPIVSIMFYLITGIA